jgi:hypothetical protein
MPSDFPRSPKFLKGALVAYESQFLGPIPNIIIFQYNPEQLRRTLASRTPAPRTQAAGESRAETFRVEGPPVENINLTVVLNATDQLEAANPIAAIKGIYPALSALELMLYPPSSQFFLNDTLSAAGSAQLQAQDVPLVLFVWGPSRVVPVRLTTFSVTEEAFDQMLNPIQAKVDMGMRVLTYMELRSTSLGYGAYLATQVQKEVMARLNLVNNVEQILGMLPI